MDEYGEKDSGTRRGPERAVPAGMMKMMERAGCCCAEMTATCEEADHDTEAAEPAGVPIDGPEAEVDP